MHSHLWIVEACKLTLETSESHLRRLNANSAHRGEKAVLELAVICRLLVKDAHIWSVEGSKADISREMLIAVRCLQ